MRSGNFAIDAMTIGSEWREWKHVFIDGGTPRCDVGKKIIYSPAFRLNLSRREEELIRGKNLHEAAHAHYTPKYSTDDPLLLDIVNALEDLRIERLLAKDNPVFGGDIRKMNAYLLEDVRGAVRDGGSVDPVAEAIAWMMFKASGLGTFRISPRAEALVAGAWEAFSRWSAAETFDDVVAIAKSVRGIWRDVAADCGGGTDAERTAPAMRGGALKDIVLNREFRSMTRLPEDTDEYVRFVENDRYATPPQDRRAYLSAREAISNSVMRIAMHMRSALMAATRSRRTRDQASGVIDRRQLAAIACGTKTNVFCRLTRGLSLDAAVTVLLDASGSMKSRETSVRQLCIALAESLEILNINFEILGYTTTEYGRDAQSRIRRTPLLTQLFKQFGESYGSCRYRLGSYRALKDNVDGESLMLAWNRNRAQRGRRHIVFVITDGLPCCMGMPNEALEKDLRNTVAHIRRHGGEVCAFGIGTDDPETFYGAENFVPVTDVSRLTQKFLRKLMEALMR